jgi:hypothetical protein
MFHSQYYLVQTVIHNQSLRSQICIYIFIILSGKRNKNIKHWDSRAWLVPRKSFSLPFWSRVPQVRHPCPSQFQQDMLLHVFNFVFSPYSVCGCGKTTARHPSRLWGTYRFDFKRFTVQNNRRMNPVRTKVYLSDLKTQSVPCSKHSLPRL